MTLIVQERRRSLLVRREEDPRLLFRAGVPREGRVVVSASDAVDRNALSDVAVMEIVLGRVIDRAVHRVELRDLARVPPREARIRATTGFDAFRTALERTAARLGMAVRDAWLSNEFGVWVAGFDICDWREIADPTGVESAPATRSAARAVECR